jgi:hypothetical protein
MLRGMLNDMGDDKRHFPNVRKIVAAYSVGEHTSDGDLCQWLFPCYDKDTQVRRLF